MELSNRSKMKTIIDREMLMQLKTCAACHRPFNLGEPVVMACGAWEGPARLIHENEAVFDNASSSYVERKCHAANRGRV